MHTAMTKGNLSKWFLPFSSTIVTWIHYGFVHQTAFNTVRVVLNPSFWWRECIVQSIDQSINSVGKQKLWPFSCFIFCCEWVEKRSIKLPQNCCASWSKTIALWSWNMTKNCRNCCGDIGQWLRKFCKSCPVRSAQLILWGYSFQENRPQD